MEFEIEAVKPNVSEFSVVGGEKAWEEVVYSSRMSGVPGIVKDLDVFNMIVHNDYGSALEHVILKFNVQMTKGNAPELLEHRMASHSGYSTRYIDASKDNLDESKNKYEIILPRDILKELNKEGMTAEEYMAWINSEEPEFLENVILNSFGRSIDHSIHAYEKLLEVGVPRESARYCLPFCQAVGIYHFTMNLRSMINFIALRTCVRASPEMRALASQFWLLLREHLPHMADLPLGCRGMMYATCPEDGVTGVRIGEQLPNYPPCPFKNEGTPIHIPTKKELRKGEVELTQFDLEVAQNTQKALHGHWAAWVGAN